MYDVSLKPDTDELMETYLYIVIYGIWYVNTYSWKKWKKYQYYL